MLHLFGRPPEAGRVQVTFNPAQTEFAVLVERIEQAGFEVSGAETTDGEGQS